MLGTADLYLFTSSKLLPITLLKYKDFTNSISVSLLDMVSMYDIE